MVRRSISIGAARSGLSSLAKVLEVRRLHVLVQRGLAGPVLVGEENGRVFVGLINVVVQAPRLGAGRGGHPQQGLFNLVFRAGLGLELGDHGQRH